MAIDQVRFDEFLGRAVNDMGAAMSGLLVVVGDRLGLYKAMADAGPMTPAALAKKTGTGERQVREWLNAQASCGYVTYDPASQTYTLPEEQALCFANEDSPAFLPGFFEMALACYKNEPKVTEGFRSGKGMGWHEHHSDLFAGTFRFFRPGYNANLVSSWIPALDGLEAKLRAGARVADVGCGHGSSTVILAKAYPKSTFVGFDYHAPSIEAARKHAAEAGVTDRVKFEVARAQDYPGKNYDAVFFFDCLHDMGDPLGAARHVRESLSARRDLDARRALRQRQGGGQSQSGGSHLLLGVHGHLHAGVAVAGGRGRSRRSGRRVPAARGGDEGRVQAVPARDARRPFNLIFEGRP